MRYIVELNEDNIAMSKFVTLDDYEKQKRDVEITKTVYEELIIPALYKNKKFKTLGEDEWPKAKEIVPYIPPEMPPTEEEDLAGLVIDLAYNQVLLELGVVDEEDNNAVQNVEAAD